MAANHDDWLLSRCVAASPVSLHLSPPLTIAYSSVFAAFGFIMKIKLHYNDGATHQASTRRFEEIAMQFIQGVVIVCVIVAAPIVLYYLIASPPLYLAYSPAPKAGPNSIYVPGTCEMVYIARSFILAIFLTVPISHTCFSLFSMKGSGFSGFWYHLGLLDQMSDDLHQYEFYCYSSGCLSLVLAFMNVTVERAFDTSYSIQQAWLQGNISRYQMVEWFLDDLLEGHHEPTFLPRIAVLLTSAKKGVEIQSATNLSELRTLLKKTTWIPFVTGQGVMMHEDDFYIDGGFSRVLHPECERTLPVPFTWKTLIYTLDPSFNRETALNFWSMGNMRRSVASR